MRFRVPTSSPPSLPHVSGFQTTCSGRSGSSSGWRRRRNWRENARKGTQGSECAYAFHRLASRRTTEGTETSRIASGRDIRAMAFRWNYPLRVWVACLIGWEGTDFQEVQNRVTRPPLEMTPLLSSYFIIIDCLIIKMFNITKISVRRLFYRFPSL